MAESTIITGQFVRIEQTPASIGERLLAFLIDYIFLILYIYGTIALLEVIPHAYRYSDNTFFVLLVFGTLYLPAFFYTFLCEMFNRGQTIGKRLMNIRVVKLDGSTPSMGSYLLRWMILPFDVFITGGLGALFVLLSKNSQRMGDLAAGTMVIKEKDYRRIHVSLDEFDYLTKNYHPVYPQASDLSLEQINVITRALETLDRKARLQRLQQLALKVQHLLSVTSRSASPEEFLRTILRDYQYYALEEA
ncbi:MAG: RDD family protein [Mediterranea sp.]|jgi:uncharacterized RDD family membrane protein YckC|nr:RDD family protein [Mediterranea sp.]